MKKDAEKLISLADDMFKKQWPVLSLWQTLSEHFYPQRADFTITRNVGTELSDNLVDSYPILVRRDLGDSLAALLRQGEWFEMGVKGQTDYEGRAWLAWATKRMRQVMLTRESNFTRATKEGDHDYSTFGQCVISTEINKLQNGLLYRCWHLRDCAWFDDENGMVGGLVRRWKPQAHQLIKTFGEDNVHPDVKKKNDKNPFAEVKCYHLCIPVEMYGDDEMGVRFKFASVYVDADHKKVMEEYGMNYFMYTVPRFQTIAGSPYAYSPATVVGLPDARTLQAMTHTLLEAGERYARPPIIATQKVIRSDVDLSPDGITWVDDEYDEKLGAALRTLPQDRGGFPIGQTLKQEIRDVLASAFYANKISLPEFNRDVTAYEFSERMKQYRREVLPLIAPIESDYNGQLCETSFDLMMMNGMLGSPYDIPESLKGKDVEFKFVSPISESEEEDKAARFSQMARLLSEAADFDVDVVENVNFDMAFRDAVEASKAPITWLHNMETVMEARQVSAQQRDAAERAQRNELDAAAAAAGQATQEIAAGA